MKGYQTDETICAVATPSGAGAIAVIRLSGSKAYDILNTVFSTDVHSFKANTIHFGSVLANGQMLDEVLVSAFRAPRSYTGEDVLEISCHGSVQVVSDIMRVLMAAGARPAKEGEFTLRAFLNGKLDLSQAEAVADLIASDSKVSRELAVNQLRGGYSGKLKEMRDQLIHFASMLELELDFSEEDVAFANRDELLKLISDLLKMIRSIMASFEQGNVLKNGVPVVILGPPNAGKSTLLNRLLSEERAIVSDIPGTTRDAIEDTVHIDGVLFRFVDTAGIRVTEDAVEIIGIQRARDKANQARLVIGLLDAANLTMEKYREVRQMLQTESDRPFLLAVNKVDVLQADQATKLKKELADEDVVLISAKDGTGIDDLQRELVSRSMPERSEGEGIIVTNARHFEALKRSADVLEKAVEGIQTGTSTELIAMDVRQSLHHLGEITGEVSTDDLLGNIFSRFCIGK